MVGRSTLSHTVRLHPNRIPEEDLGSLVRACVAVLREGRPTRTFTDDLLEWATRDRLRRRDLQAREEGDTDKHGCTYPFGPRGDGWHRDTHKPPINLDAREENEELLRGAFPHEPQIFTLDPRAWTDRALSDALAEYHSGLVSLLGDPTGPHAKAITTWLRFGRVLFAEIGKRLRKGK